MVSRQKWEYYLPSSQAAGECGRGTDLQLSDEFESIWSCGCCLIWQASHVRDCRNAPGSWAAPSKHYSRMPAVWLSTVAGNIALAAFNARHKHSPHTYVSHQPTFSFIHYLSGQAMTRQTPHTQLFPRQRVAPRTKSECGSVSKCNWFVNILGEYLCPLRS